MNGDNTLELRSTLIHQLFELEVWGIDRYRFYVANARGVTEDAKILMIGVDCNRYLRPYYNWVAEKFGTADFAKLDFPDINKELSYQFSRYQPLQVKTGVDMQQVIGKEVTRVETYEFETETWRTALLTYFIRVAFRTDAIYASTTLISESLRQVNDLFLLSQKESLILQP